MALIDKEFIKTHTENIKNAHAEKSASPKNKKQKCHYKGCNTDTFKNEKTPSISDVVLKWIFQTNKIYDFFHQGVISEQ